MGLQPIPFSHSGTCPVLPGRLTGGQAPSLDEIPRPLSTRPCDFLCMGAARYRQEPVISSEAQSRNLTADGACLSVAAGTNRNLPPDSARTRDGGQPRVDTIELVRIARFCRLPARGFFLRAAARGFFPLRPWPFRLLARAAFALRASAGPGTCRGSA